MLRSSPLEVSLFVLNRQPALPTIANYDRFNCQRNNVFISLIDSAKVSGFIVV